MKNQKVLLVLIVVLFINLSTQFSVYGNERWLKVKTKNFTLIGNAKEEQIKRVGIKLEQFREAIRRLVPTLSADSPTSTTVIVFKDNQSFHPYKPMNSKGKITEWVAGYFQAGFDINYIALSFERKNSSAYKTIFHEYTHYLIDYNIGRTNVPPWFGEGLAEYYDQFNVRKDRIVQIGGRNHAHLQMLKKNELIPLKRFFSLDYITLRSQTQNSANLFYAQSWALMQFLLRGENGIRNKQLDKFIKLIRKNVDTKTAFKKAFRMSYFELENRLKNFIKAGKFYRTTTKFDNKLTDEMNVSSSYFPRSEVEAHLGDLFYQREKFDLSEKHLLKALQLNPNSNLANSTLGLVRYKQDRYDEANRHMELAVKSNETNYLPYFRYAYFLSREVMSFDSYISNYSDERTAKMRNALKKAIKLNPTFARSYRLMGFINLVRNENLDEGINYLKKALEIIPNKQTYSLNLASLYLRKKDFDNAKLIAKSIIESPNDDALRSKAEGLLREIKNAEEEIAKNKLEQLASQNLKISNIKKSSRALTEEELERNRKQTANEAISEVLRKPKAGEKRIVGQISNVACVKNKVIFTLVSEDQTNQLQSKSFTELLLRTFTSEMRGVNFGCNTNKKDISAVLIYKPAKKTTGEILGDIISIEFVPKNFVLVGNK